MPFTIVKRGKKWAVITKGTGKVHGTHLSKRAASAQVRAMYANGADKDRK